MAFNLYASHEQKNGRFLHEAGVDLPQNGFKLRLLVTSIPCQCLQVIKRRGKISIHTLIPFFQTSFLCFAFIAFSFTSGK